MKATYESKPQEIEIHKVDETRSKVFLRENIAQSAVGWMCDEYLITASPENLVARVEKNRTRWIVQAKESEEKRAVSKGGDIT